MAIWDGLTRLLYCRISSRLVDRHEPLSFAIQYEATRKALGYGIGAFKAIYAAYKLQRGAV